MKIAIGCDHAALRLKNIILNTIKDVEFADVGTYSEDSCDYPDYALAVGHKVVSGEADLGIVLCGSGIGISIAVNKIHGIRAALCTNGYMAEMSRRHNDANVLAIGARIVGDDLAVDIVKKWLGASFDGGRHQRRVDKISEIENRNG